jgi:hypothetical protein
MAIFHLNAKTIGRSQGRSATGAAAYRAAMRIVDQRSGVVFDYTRKRGVDGAEILTPDGSAPDRAALWNAAEKIEKRRDAQVAREVEVALPRELTPEQMRGVVRAFAHEQFVALGMVADIAFHHLTGSNPHAHILLSLREWQGTGFGLKRREWNERALCIQWRERWADHANAALANAGHATRIDHRTLTEQAATALQEQRHTDAIALDRQATVHERGSPAAEAHNAKVREANAARLMEWRAIEQAAQDAAQSMPPESDRAPGQGAKTLAAQDLEFVEGMRRSSEPKALRWRFHDNQSRTAAEWLAAKVGGDARRLAAHETAVRLARLEEIAWQVWQEEHPRPFWPWRWPRWRHEKDEALAAYEDRRRAAKRAGRRASPEAIEAWRAAYRAKEAEQASARAARRAIALTPDEEAQARRERQDVRRARGRAQGTTRAPPTAPTPTHRAPRLR